MERLTTRREDGSIETKGQAWSDFDMCVVPCTRGNDKHDVRLAEYEDTGLTPAEVTELRDRLQQAEADNAAIKDYAGNGFDMARWLQEFYDQCQDWKLGHHDSEKVLTVILNCLEEIKPLFEDANEKWDALPDTGAALLKELEGLRKAYTLACKFLSQKHRGWPPNMSEIFNETEEAWEVYFKRQAMADLEKEGPA